jgi:23S rRNA (cytidine1920-2'-O)/16S rRNA (cytidine1409-2'-O)-methyltransferase
MKYDAKKRRLDEILVERGDFRSRARAQAAIRSGFVRVDGAVATKPGHAVRADAKIEVAGDIHPFVSRGGVKLQAALGAFDIDATRKTCLDLGASTGGFTDLLLRAGAAKIYAVDVGHGQLDVKIASDARVINLEKTHARDLSRAMVPDAVELIVCDVSFISLRKALPPALALAGPNAALVALIKPQFELGPQAIGKGGSVLAGDEEIAALIDATRAFLDDQGWQVIGVIDSPILGGDGNREHLIGAIKRAQE